ncbi:MAG: shikimate kinase [Candidatus Lokiarchaeota archaeon]|nr:shikimate kinase [Candidatus Lokiarchaeota archaeon]
MNPKQMNIGLIGFMATGKTTIGRHLADVLSWRFCDTDEIIESRAGKEISQIFSEEGEDTFRLLESDVIKEVCGLKTTVISFGGGAPFTPENRRLIEENVSVVLLRASADTIVARTSESATRPLLNVEEGDLERRVQSILNKRNEIYTEMMDVEVWTDELNVEEAVYIIVERLKL